MTRTSTRANRRTRLVAALTAAAVLAALACGATAGIASDKQAAGEAGANDAQATEEAAAVGTEDVVAFHANLGFDFDAIAEQAAADLGDDATAAEKSATVVGTREFCLSCHDWDAIVDSTELAGDVTVYNKQGLYNVHDNHNGLVDCADCHTIGSTSTLGCVGCHYMELPEGWEGFY